MIKQLLLKLKESLIAVGPIVAFILLIGITPIPLFNLEKGEIIGFVFASIMVIIGIGLFNLGADMAMTPMEKFIKKKNKELK